MTIYKKRSHFALTPHIYNCCGRKFAFEGCRNYTKWHYKSLNDDFYTIGHYYYCKKYAKKTRINIKE